MHSWSRIWREYGTGRGLRFEFAFDAMDSAVKLCSAVKLSERWQLLRLESRSMKVHGLTE